MLQGCKARSSGGDKGDRRAVQMTDAQLRRLIDPRWPPSSTGRLTRSTGPLCGLSTYSFGE